MALNTCFWPLECDVSRPLEGISLTFDLLSLGLKDKVIMFQWSKVKITVTLYESGRKKYLETQKLHWLVEAYNRSVVVLVFCFLTYNDVSLMK